MSVSDGQIENQEMNHESLHDVLRNVAVSESTLLLPLATEWMTAWAIANSKGPNLNTLENRKYYIALHKYLFPPTTMYQIPPELLTDIACRVDHYVSISKYIRETS